MRRTLLSTALIVVMAAALSAQEFTVSYMEGKAELGSGQSWREIALGDQVVPDAVIRLSPQSYLEIAGGGQTISVSRAGTYALRRLLANNQQMAAAGVRSALSARLTTLFGAPEEKGTAMGIRGENAAPDNGVSWITSDAQVYIDSGKEYVKSGDYAKAIAEFKQAVEYASGNEIPEAHYYLGYAYSLNGDTRSALKEVADLSPNDLAAGAPDLIVLKAKLLLDTSAFEDGVDWLTSHEALVGHDSSRGPVYFLLLGLSYNGAGDTAKAKENLEKVVTLAGSTDLGRSAAALLKQL